MEVLPLISVIVPVYNVEKYLARCVNSITNQTYKNLEIVLVDDGATDSSGTLCDQLAELDSRINVIHKPNGGLSDARNVGFSNSKGEFVCFIDSDDWVEKNYISHLFDLIVNHSCDIAGCAYRKCENVCPEIETPTGYALKSFVKETAMSLLIDNVIQQVVWNKLYKRSIIEDIAFAKGKYHEDEFWSYQVFAKIQKYVQTDYIGYNYFQRADSIMGDRYSLKRLDAVEAKKQRQNFLDANLKALASKGRKNLVFTCFYHGQLSLLHLNGREREEAVGYLEDVLKSNKLHREDYAEASITHKIWMWLSQHSFLTACRLRNMLKVGI